jgi:hypothetical protein
MIGYLVASIKKKPRSIKIGVFTIFLVVSFITLLGNAVQTSKIIFMKLSEDTVGEADFILQALPGANYSTSGNYYY